jgi:hypothetical protein
MTHDMVVEDRIRRYLYAVEQDLPKRLRDDIKKRSSHPFNRSFGSCAATLKQTTSGVTEPLIHQGESSTRRPETAH